MARYLIVVAVAVAGVAMLLTGCGGGGGDADTAVLRVAMTDQATYDSVVVAIREIRVVPEGDDNDPTGPGLPLIASFDPPRVVDIQDLEFAQLLLGEALVPVGEYAQVRLVLEPNVAGQEPVNYVTLAGDPDTRIPLVTPSGQQSGLKIVGRFTVEAGVINAIVLDFDPAKAIVITGNGRYQLKPTGIRIVQVDELLDTFGGITGTVSPEDARDDAVVRVIPEGQADAIAAGTVNPDDGTFRALVPPGSYYLVISATGFEVYDTSALDPPQFFAVVAQTDVAAGEITLTATP